MNSPYVETTDRSVSCTIEIEAGAETIFRVWADVAQWHTWDPDTEWARIDGPFATGTRGKIKAKQPLAASMTLTDVQPNRAFTATIRALATRMDFDHTVEQVRPQTTRVVHTVRFSGLLAGLFRKQIGAPLVHGLPVTLSQLKQRCEREPITPSK
jgi:hypothetical protein